MPRINLHEFKASKVRELTGRRREAALLLLREMMQSCEGAMKSLRSDACSAGENLLDDITGRPDPANPALTSRLVSLGAGRWGCFRKAQRRLACSLRSGRGARSGEARRVQYPAAASRGGTGGGRQGGEGVLVWGGGAVGFNLRDELKRKAGASCCFGPLWLGEAGQMAYKTQA